MPPQVAPPLQLLVAEAAGQGLSATAEQTAGHTADAGISAGALKRHIPGTLEHQAAHQPASSEPTPHLVHGRLAPGDAF